MPGYWKQLSRHAAAFALLSDFALLTLGGALKRKEMISARLGDILSELYLLGAVLKRFETEGRHEEDRPIVDYVMRQGQGRIAAALAGVLDNLPARWATFLVRLLAFPMGVPAPMPSDELTNEVAETLMKDSPQRDRLTPDVYLGEGHKEHPLKDLEQAFRLVTAAAHIEKKMREEHARDPKDARDRRSSSSLPKPRRRPTAWWPSTRFPWKRYRRLLRSTAGKRRLATGAPHAPRLPNRCRRRELALQSKCSRRTRCRIRATIRRA
jgi:hypothetical protein